ncbi:MAG: VanZ family protein [bacterium]
MLYLINSTLDAQWPTFIMIIIIYIVMKYNYLEQTKQRKKLYIELHNLLFIVYVFLLVSIVSYGKLNTTSGFNLIPFKEILRYEFLSDLFMLNIVGNILLYAPLGYFMTSFLKRITLKSVLFSGILISLCGEIMQYHIGRTFDIDDIILNGAGIIVGWSICKILNGIKSKMPKFLQKDGLYNAISIIIIIVLILYILNVKGVITIL